MRQTQPRSSPSSSNQTKPNPQPSTMEDTLMTEPEPTEDAPKAEPEPLTPLAEPVPSPPEPEPQPNGVLPDPTAQPNSDPSEPVAQPDPVPSEPTAQPDPVPSEPTAQPDSGPSEPTIVQTEPDGVIPPPQTAPAPAPVVETPRRKRKIEEVGFENSTYFKIRSIVKNLRPLFFQVSENPNFRETNIPVDILKEITTILNLSKQLRADLTAFSAPPKPSSIKDEPQKETPANNSTENEILTEDEKLLNETKDVPKNLEDGFKGSYVVGGSPVGWNFLVYPGSQPVYYGRTKAEKLACQIAS